MPLRLPHGLSPLPRLSHRSLTTLRPTLPLRTTRPTREPLAQKLNIDDPTSNTLREKTQTAQAEIENLTEPDVAAAESSPKDQPTREPEVQREDKDEPPAGGLRDQVQDQMAKSENTDST